MPVLRAENKGASNVNDAPLLAFDAPNKNLMRHDDASIVAIIERIISTNSSKIVILTRQYLE